MSSEQETKSSHAANVNRVSDNKNKRILHQFTSADNIKFDDFGNQSEKKYNRGKKQKHKQITERSYLPARE